MKVYYTKEISSAHRLLLDYKSKCQRLHGHNYRVEIFLNGSLNESGMVIDFTHLKDAILRYDHIFLNDIIEQPTVENLVLKLLEDLKNLPEIANISKITVRIWEDSESYAEESWISDD